MRAPGEILLALAALLTVCLTAYSFGHYLSVLVFLFRRSKPAGADSSDQAIAVLVPARNERERALRVITSLLEQDYPGPIEIYLLVKDGQDSSIPFLEKQFPQVDFRSAGSSLIEMQRAGNRRVAIVYTGVDAKSGKVNFMVDRLANPWMAILDCDHQAHPDWIRTSMALLAQNKARIIQGRREPISAHGFFKLWDSLHQHVGCELFNAAFTTASLTVFFSGTTTVMETALLKARPLSPCITEDIDFSYDLVQRGVTIITNPRSGSDEENSPDLYSFLARRRRWANGHTEAFFRHLPGFFKAPLSPLARAQLLFHGSHYLVAVVVFSLHLLIGAFFFGHLSRFSQGAAVLSGLTLAAMVGGTQRTVGWRDRAVEVAVMFFWITPALVIAMNLVQAFLVGDLTRAALPIPGVIQALGVVGLCAPLVVLLIGLAGFGELNAGSLLAVVITYPLAFYLDMSGVLLGLTDWLTGQARWRVVSRTEPALSAVTANAARLLPVEGIKESFRLRAFLGRPSNGLQQKLLAKRKTLFSGGMLTILFGVGALYGPSHPVQAVAARCQALPSDTDPWIVPAKKLEGYCDGSVNPAPQWGKQTGNFKLVREDDLHSLDPKFWDTIDKTFFCNEAAFQPENVVPLPGGGVRMKIEKHAAQGRDYTSGDIATKNSDDARFTFGRFEAVLKPTKVSGVITGMFLYRFDPWQEIDAEFVGRDTTKILLNVFYNPGEQGDLYNYGLKGTPVLVDLGFDAAADFHRYAVEWESKEIRWFVDDKLVHVRRAGRPTPIPQLPMRFHVNTWPICSEELAGPFLPTEAPMGTDLKSVAISRWYPPPQDLLLGFLHKRFTPGKDWRQEASWMQP